MNPANHRVQYSGAPLKVAKAVCDSAHGGQILMTLNVRSLAAGWLGDSSNSVLLADEGMKD